MKSQPGSASGWSVRLGRVAVGLIATLMTWGCARELPPPGARPDETPPVVERIRPAPDSVVAGFDGQVEIRFDEPVNIPDNLGRLMFASPMEEYESEKGFSNFKFRPREGWRDSVVYCYSIPGDGISDLLRNRMEADTEFCFSTGLPVEDTRVRGNVIDGVTRLAQGDARVVFFATGDTTPYGAITDSEGAFSARALPPGEYQAFGFLDQNGNLTLDRDVEPHDSATFVASLEEIPDLSFATIPPDTTPPVLGRVVAADSMTLELEFDDYLRNPHEEEPQVSVRDSVTGAELDVVLVGIGTASEAGFPPLETASEDSLGLAGDSLGALAAPVPADPTAAFPELDAPSDSLPGRGTPATLPSRFISARLAVGLDSATYIVSARGVVNLRNLVGGGDTTFLSEPTPPEPDSGEFSFDLGDTLGLPPPDTLGLDTLGLPPDTLAGLDTLGLPPDTLAPARRTWPDAARPPEDRQGVNGGRSHDAAIRSRRDD